MSGGKSSREKGARYERKIAAWLTERLGETVSTFERRLEQWRKGGDDFVHELEAWLSLEAKDVAASSVGSWIDQSVRSAGTRIAVVIHHRRGNADPANDFATLPLSDLAVLIERVALCECPGSDPEVDR